MILEETMWYRNHLQTPAKRCVAVNSRLLLLVLLLLTVALLLIAGCVRNPSAPQRAVAPALPVPPTVSVTNEFVGNSACAECHLQEFKAHGASRHSETLHTV